jgi:hypothetical protein
MNQGIKIIGGVLLAAVLSTPAWAKHGKPGGPPGGGESMAGGLPGLEDRVEADEALITALQGKNNFAVVAADGTLARSSSVPGPVTVEHTATTGIYEVNFNKNVSGCAYEATIGDTASTAPAQGQISVSGDVNADSVDDVYVQTFDKTGVTLTDSPFHLTVTCP